MRASVSLPLLPGCDREHAIAMNLKGLRLCLVGPLPRPAGGMAVLTRQLGDPLEREGLAVRLVQVNAPYRPTWIEHAKGAHALFRLLPYMARLWQEIGRAQLVHVTANSGWSWYLYAAPVLVIAEWRGVPVVVNYHGGEAEQFLKGAAVRVRRQLRRARSLLVPSNFLVDVFGRHGIAERVLPNVVDLSRFAAAARWSRIPAAPHVIVARNLEFVYGVDIAIKAFAQISVVLPQARLTLAGSGPERALHAPHRTRHPAQAARGDGAGAAVRGLGCGRAQGADPRRRNRQTVQGRQRRGARRCHRRHARPPRERWPATREAGRHFVEDVRDRRNRRGELRARVCQSRNVSDIGPVSLLSLMPLEKVWEYGKRIKNVQRELEAG